jgi:hypothetical protein
MFHFLETSADPIRMTLYLLAWLILFSIDVRAQETISICLEQAQKATFAEHARPVQQVAAKSLPARENPSRLSTTWKSMGPEKTRIDLAASLQRTPRLAH